MESHFNVWDETVDVGPGDQTRAAVVVHNTGYVFCRLDPSANRLYFGTENDPYVAYDTSFVNGETTRRYSHYIEDASLGSQIVYSFNDGGRAYIVTGSPGTTEATVVVFDEAWWYGSPLSTVCPAKFTLDTGYDPTLSQFHFAHNEGLLKFIQRTPTESWHSYNQDDYPGYVDTPAYSVWVGQCTVPSTVQRYRDVSNAEVYPFDDAAVTVTCDSTSYSMYLPTIPYALYGEGYTVSSVQHLSQSGWWSYQDPGGSAGEYEWMHHLQIIWGNGVDSKVTRAEMRVGFDHGYYGMQVAVHTHNPARGFLHSEAEFFRLDHFNYVKFGASGWEIWYHNSSSPNPLFETDATIPYPVEPDEILQPEQFRIGFDRYTGLIVGPLIVKDGELQLLCAQLRPYEYPDFEPFSPGYGADAIYGNGEVTTWSVPAEQSPLVYSVNPTESVYRCIFDYTRVTTAADVPVERRFAAAVSLTARNPVNPEAPDVVHLAFVSDDMNASVIYVDYDDIDSDGGGGGNGKLIFDTYEDAAVSIDTELSPTENLSADFRASLDGAVALSVQQNPTQDVAVAAETEADAAVLVKSDYQDEDVDPQQEPQLFFSATLSMLEDYEDELFSAVFDSTEHDALVALEPSIVFGDVDVLAWLEMGAEASVGVEGYSEGAPPTPGTCPVGGTWYTVTLPPGADPLAPLVYLVDGRIVMVVYEDTVLDTFYLDTPDLSKFCLRVLSSDGVPVVSTDPIVTPMTPATYSVVTARDEFDLFMLREGDFKGRVQRGSSLIISDTGITEQEYIVSPDDFTDDVIVLQFGYVYPDVDFNLAARIAAAGFGKYLRV